MATTTTVVKGSLGEKLMLGETIAVIDGVVAAYPLDEEDREVNPTVICDSNPIPFYTAFGTGIVATNDSTVFPNGLKLVYTDATKWAGVIHIFGTYQDWTSKNVWRRKMYGSNSGVTFQIKIQAPDDSNYFHYVIKDNFVGEKQFAIPFSSFTSIGSPSWATVRSTEIHCQVANVTGTWYFEREVIDVGVPAVDYSGNGNHGATTGTQIVAHPLYPNKTARKYLYNGDITVIPANPLFQKTKFTILFTVQPQGTWTTAVPRIAENTVFAKGWSLCFDENKRIIFSRNGNGVENGWKHTLRSRVIGNLEVVQVAIVVDGVSRSIYINQETPVTAADTEAIIPSNGSLKLSVEGTNFGRMILSDVAFIPDVALTDEQIYALHGGVSYPDPRLEQGKIHVRKIKNLQYKVNQIIAPKLAAGKKAVVKTTEIGDEAWAVIVTEN